MIEVGLFVPNYSLQEHYPATPGTEASGAYGFISIPLQGAGRL